MNALDVALFTKLTGVSALTTLLANGTASVFAYLAPENENPPYVVFSPQSPPAPRRVIGGGGSVAYETTVYLVKGITESPSAAFAGSIAAQIDAALDRLASLTITGYTLMRCERQQSISYPEVFAGKRFNHAGAVYRIQLLPS